MSAQSNPVADLTAVDPTPDQASKPSRILVAEDDISIRRLNAEVLKRSGYEVDAAEDGAAAWEALKKDNYALLITDNNMPKLSGVELLRKLRTARLALPVILVSGAMPTEELDRHPWLQIDATLLKPYTCEELLGPVKEVLRAINDDRMPSVPRQNWRSQPTAAGLRL